MRSERTAVGCGGERIDKAAAALFEISRAAAQKLIEQGNLLVGGQPVPKSYRVQEGDVLTCDVPEPEPLAARPEEIALDVVYEDDALLVVNKPQGMVVHPASGSPDGTLVNALLYHCGESLSGINGVIRPGIVHRIDKDTSGLLVVAKTDRAHAGLSEQIKAHTMTREYLALVHGNLNADSLTIDRPIGRSPKDRKKMAVVPGGREAVTHVSVERRYRGYTLVRCRLETGRTHQIRVHMSSLGHSVVGDPVYGPRREEFTLAGQLLHARLLGFRHPETGNDLEFEAPLPPYFADVLARLEHRS